MPAKRIWDDGKATETPSIGAKELGVGRKERPARAKGGESWAVGDLGSSSMEADNWYECHEPLPAIIWWAIVMYYGREEMMYWE